MRGLGMSTPDQQSRPGNLVDGSPDLVRPQALTVDRSLSEERAAQLVPPAQQICTFWHTGEQEYLQAAVSEDFTDNTPLPGRPQGPAGLSFAPARFRAAVPDLTRELWDVLVVEFNAIDVQHADSEKIVEDWHMEANQAPAAQLSAGSPARNRAEEGVWIR